VLGIGVWSGDGSTLWYWGVFGTPRTIANGEPFLVPALGGTIRGHL
jgi:hypothetical protein